MKRCFALCAFTALLAALWFPVKYLAKKKFSPLTLIAIAACRGVLVYGL